MANKLLALLILLPMFPILSNYKFYMGSVMSFPDWLFFSQVVFSFFGPIYLFYCLEMIGRPLRYSHNKLIHLIPAIAISVLWVNYLLSSDAEQQRFIESFSLSEVTSMEMMIASILPPFIVLIYIVISAKIVYRQRLAYKEVYTNLESLKVDYIREFIYVIIVEMAVLAIVYFLFPIIYIDLIWTPLLANVMYFYIIYKSYNYGVIFSEEDYKDFQKMYAPLNRYIEDTKLKKYAGHALSEQRINEYALILKAGFENEQWYLDPELNLNVVSLKSGIASHYISRIVNQQFGRNFFDYVNAYRVEELKKKLENAAFDHIKLEEIAYMCGFNSKAAFQRAFKKHTDMTPSEYKNIRCELALTKAE